LKRIYENEVKIRVSLISLAQTAGFSLLEIKQMIGAEGRPDLDRNALAVKTDEIDNKIKKLTALRNGLHHISKCTAENNLDCPRFQRIMHISLKKKVAKKT